MERISFTSRIGSYVVVDDDDDDFVELLPIERSTIPFVLQRKFGGGWMVSESETR